MPAMYEDPAPAYVFPAKIQKIWIMRCVDIPRNVCKSLRGKRPKAIRCTYRFAVGSRLTVQEHAGTEGKRCLSSSRP